MKTRHALTHRPRSAFIATCECGKLGGTIQTPVPCLCLYTYSVEPQGRIKAQQSHLQLAGVCEAMPPGVQLGNADHKEEMTME